MLQVQDQVVELQDKYDNDTDRQKGRAFMVSGPSPRLSEPRDRA